MDTVQKLSELENLVMNIQGGVLICKLDDKFTILYMNNGFCNLVGYTCEEIEGLFNNQHTPLILKSQIKSLRRSIITQLKNGNCFTVEYQMIKKDGSLIWVFAKGGLMENENGETHVHCVFTDITAQKVILEEIEHNRQLLIQKNKELMLSKMRYEIAMQNSKDIIFDYIIQTKKIICTQSNIQSFIAKHSLEDDIEYVISSGIVHPNSIGIIRDAFKKIDEGIPYLSVTITGIIDDGKEVLFEVSLTNVLDEAGKPVRAIGVIHNINEKRMLQSEKKYRRAMTSDKLYANELNITQNTIVSTSSDFVKSFGIPKFNMVSQMVDYMCQNLVHADYEQVFRDFFDKDNITSAFYNGKIQIVVQYLTKYEDNRYTWVEATMNIICDDTTNDIKTRLYLKNINEKQENEIKSIEERRFYKAMLTNAVIVYKVNITQNLVECENEYFQDLFKVTHTNNYCEMVNTFLDKFIYHEDINLVKETILRENVLRRYASGQSKIFFEFRRISKELKFKWMSCDIHLFKDTKNNDIKGFCYIQDINEQKVKELDLIYKAEHDSLTGFYNKGTVERYIDKYLDSDEGKMGKHAFFIFDIDYFRTINNIFGHAFGDAILSRVTQKIRDLFRDVDILGRIGGDEFVILMKNIRSGKSALTKANEMCSVLRETYTKNKMKYNISISIGIAISSCEITTYSKLYKQSDAALYQAKEQGRNQFFIYDNSMDSRTCDVEKIPELELIESKSFEKNISEYVFRILYESANKPNAINTVLGLIGQQYNISRSYVFEKSNDGTCMKNTFEWCNEEITSHINGRQNISCEYFENYSKNFNKNGIFYITDLSKAPTGIKELLGLTNAKKILQFLLIKNNVFSGFIGFEQYELGENLSRNDITNLMNVANILNVFINEMRATLPCENVI